MPWVKVASIGDVAEDDAIEVIVGTRSIALYKVGGTIHATDNICTHGSAKLHRGYLDGCLIECPLHQGVFDIRTGEPVDGPVSDPLAVFEVRIEGEDILLNI